MDEQTGCDQPTHLLTHKMVPSCYHNRVVCGMSGSGKSMECLKFISNFNDYYPSIRVRKLVIIAPIFHSQYNILKEKYEVVYYSNLDEAMDEFGVGETNTVCLILIDDMACQLSHSKNLEKLFTTMTRHNRLNVSLTSQSIFQSSSEIWRSIIKNAHVIILTNSPRERRSVQILFSQLFGNKGLQLAESVIKDCLKENDKRYGNPYFFLYLNLSPDCNPSLQIVYDNLSPEPIVYLYK